MKIPPDWDMAKWHGKANRVLDSENMHLDIQDKLSYCPCCEMPYPKKKDFFSIYCNNGDLGIMGAGYPLLLELIKHIVYLLFVLTLVYSVPNGLLILQSIDFVKDNLKDDDSDIGLYSIGAYLKELNQLSSQSYHPQFELKIQTYLLLLILSIGFSFVYLIWMRYRILKISFDLDMDLYTPSDFCLMGVNMEFKNYSPDAIEQEIKQTFETDFGVEVEFVNVAYEVVDYVEIC